MRWQLDQKSKLIRNSKLLKKISINIDLLWIDYYTTAPEDHSMTEIDSLLIEKKE